MTDTAEPDFKIDEEPEGAYDGSEPEPDPDEEKDERTGKHKV